MTRTLIDTPFTRRLGVRLAIQQAGMGAVSTPALAGAVARAGALGMIAAAGLDEESLRHQLGEARARSGEQGRVGVNFLMPFLDLGVLDIAASESPFVECFYGDPDPAVIDRIHGGGALAGWQVGSREEALAAAHAGCDVLVAQGVEAGGHVRGDTPLIELLVSIRGDTDLPLVAAGGLATGEAIVAALSAGADAVRLGTRLLATEEADVHPAYADALVRATANDTVVTDAFSMGWPDAPHRVLRSCVMACDDDPSVRSPIPPTRSFTGDVATAALYAGTSVDHIDDVPPAAEVIARLVAEVEGEAAH